MENEKIRYKTVSLIKHSCEIFNDLLICNYCGVVFSKQVSIYRCPCCQTRYEEVKEY